MAEAIGLATSIIALAQAAVIVRELIVYVSSISSACQELKAFESEPKQLNSVIFKIEEFVRSL